MQRGADLDRVHSAAAPKSTAAPVPASEFRPESRDVVERRDCREASASGRSFRRFALCECMGRGESMARR